ncbi:hypothetical protein TorRG33x02_236120 [Trema orientale]|uniref:Uncharacterized protein n=1 Tax=Trema orientale TaxID=63057 RepID=A0A2P5E190_TREOI|nr:hypothetical protein TorRG33x02_236120 [Trema orientale]
MGVDTASSGSSCLSKPGSSMAGKRGRKIGVDIRSSRSGYLISPVKKRREMGADTTSSKSSYLTIPGSSMAAKYLGDVVVAAASSGCGYLIIPGSSISVKHGGEMVVDTTSSRKSYLTIPGSSMATKHVGEMVLATASGCDYLTIPGSSMAAKPGSEMVVDTTSSVLECESTKFGEDDELPNYIEAANQFSAYIFEHSKVKEGINIEEIESKVITDKNTVVIEEGQVYKKKKLLKSIMSLHSFREHF